MADNNLFFKVLAALSDTEYFTFLFFFFQVLAELSGKCHYFLIFFETLPYLKLLN